MITMTCEPSGIGIVSSRIQCSVTHNRLSCGGTPCTLLHCDRGSASKNQNSHNWSCNPEPPELGLLAKAFPDGFLEGVHDHVTRRLDHSLDARVVSSMKQHHTINAVRWQRRSFD
jgi:hypothetical protein